MKELEEHGLEYAKDNLLNDNGYVFGAFIAFIPAHTTYF